MNEEWWKGCALIAVLIIIIGSITFGFISKHIFGNKQIIDFNHQNFKVAYVLGDNNKWEKVNIKAWKDWEKSDSIQVITEDGNVIYTHLSNVKLMEK